MNPQTPQTGLQILQNAFAPGGGLAWTGNSTTHNLGATTGINTSINSIPTTQTTQPIHTTQVSTTPNASDVSNPNSLNVPTPKPDTTQTSLQSTTAGSFTPPQMPYDTTSGALTDYGRTNGYPDVNAPKQTQDTSSATRDAALNKILGLNEQIGTQADTRANLNQQLGVDTKQQNYIDAYNQYQQKSVQYQQQINNIYNQPGITREQAGQQVAEINRVNNADLANLAIITQTAQGNYTTALDIVQRKIDAEYKPMQTQIDNLTNFLESNKADLTQSQQDIITGQITQQTDLLNKQSDAKKSVYDTLIQYGMADAQTLSKLDQAKSLGDIFAIGATVTGNSNYGQNNGQNGGQNTNIVSSLPAMIQPAYRETRNGSYYIDIGKIPTQNQQQARVISSQTGIPLLDSTEVSAVQGIDNAMENLKTLETNFNTLAPQSAWSAYGSKITNPLSKLADTDYGSALKAFQANRDQLFQQINALAGSHPRINGQEITIAANALPKLDVLNTDTYKDGQNKLAIVHQYLNNALSTFIPNANKTTSQGSQTGTGGWASLGD